METSFLASLFNALKALGLFVALGQFFKPYILAWGEDALYWGLWAALWLSAALTALLAGALF
ncbi:MAG: hypothetical protein ACPGWR_26940 [Ardenticatenaceae bacterium]